MKGLTSDSKSQSNIMLQPEYHENLYMQDQSVLKSEMFPADKSRPLGGAARRIQNNSKNGPVMTNRSMVNSSAMKYHNQSVFSS
jgi:hypothetical protein